MRVATFYNEAAWQQMVADMLTYMHSNAKGEPLVPRITSHGITAQRSRP